MGEAHPAPALSPAARQAAIIALQEEQLDVLVVGGGVVGTGAALDAASRGLRVGLVEANDFAAGASSASSKLVHGGVRYLQMLDFALVREALGERGLLLRLAPHLVTPVPFLFPLRHRVWERAYVGAGLSLYDVLARIGGGRLPRHRQLSRRRASAIAPSVRLGLLVGGIEYWDAQVDDARFVVQLARSAAGLGAHLLTGATVVGLLGDGPDRGEGAPGGQVRGGQVRGGQVRGVTVRLEDGRELEIRARAVLAATGAWSGELERLAGSAGSAGAAGAAGAAGPGLRPSKGVHLVIPRSAVRSSHALVVATDRSVLFVLPWKQHWIIGTTDTPWSLGPDRPVASRADVEYLLGEANKVLDPPITDGDIEAVYAGLRPLVAKSGAETTKVSREHAVTRLAHGLYMITGGKYTTYRVMARDAIDALAGELGRDVAPSATAGIPVAGADGFAERWASRQEIARAHGLEPAVVEHLLRRYGGLVDEVLEYGAASAGSPSSGLLAALPGGAGYLVAEARYAASHEGARHLGDVIERRLRLSMESADRGWEAAPAVAAAVAPVLGWDDETSRAEVERYRRHVELARLAEHAPDDEAAERIVSGAAAAGTSPPRANDAAAGRTVVGAAEPATPVAEQ